MAVSLVKQNGGGYMLEGRCKW